MITFVAWLVVGLLAGWITNMLLNSGRGGFLADLLLGIVGSFAGGLVGSAFFNGGVTGVNATSVMLSILGAIIVVALYRVVTDQPLRQ